MVESNASSIGQLVFPYKQYVLALPGWYPTWLDPYPGDFNQRHIVAASQHIPQIVLYIGKDQTGTLATTQIKFNQLTPRVIEIYVVYPLGSLKIIEGARSNIIFWQLLHKYARLIEGHWGKPLLLHSYIVLKGGLAGMLLKRKWHIPLLLTENWTIYYPTDPGYLLKRTLLFQTIVKRIYASLDMFLPVTQNLNQQVNKLLNGPPFTIVPNVVDTNTFYVDKSIVRPAVFQFVHVSTMIYQKNPEGLLTSFKALLEAGFKATLLMVGPYPASVYQYARQLQLSGNVTFTGGVHYQQVALFIKQSHALVLFSRYENLPCVILEALCAGLPVLCTRVGGVSEVINESNGLIIESEDEAALLKSMQHLIDNYGQYNSRAIAGNANQRFSYQVVGYQINQAYTTLLKP